MLTINISELLLTILSFFALMFLLNKLLFKPVISFRAQRQKRVEGCHEQERQAEEKLAETRRELDERRALSLKEAENILVQGRTQAQAEADRTTRQAHAEAESTMRRAEDEARSLREAGGKAIEEKRRQLAQSLADRLCR